MNYDFFANLKRIFIWAHRGGSGTYPDNTIHAFENSANLGVDGFEFDIWTSRDNQLVLSHSDDLSRYTDKSIRIPSSNWEDIAELDAGYWWTDDDGETFPFRGKGYKFILLDDLLNAFPDMFFNIDIKDPDKKAPLILADQLKKHNKEKDVLVGSFHTKQIKRLKKYSPETGTILGVREAVVFLAKSLLGLKNQNIKHQALELPFSYLKNILRINKHFVEYGHANNLSVHIWDVDTQNRATGLRKLGVDGIFTSHPEKFISNKH